MYSNFSLSEIRRADNELSGLFGTIGKALGKAGKFVASATGSALNAQLLTAGGLPASVAVDPNTLQTRVVLTSPNAANTGVGGAALTTAEAEFLAQQRAAQAVADERSRNQLPAWVIPAAIGGAGLLLVLTLGRK